MAEVFYKGADIEVALSLWADDKRKKQVPLEGYRVDALVYTDGAVVVRLSSEAGSIRLEPDGAGGMKATIKAEPLLPLACGTAHVDIRLTGKTSNIRTVDTSAAFVLEYSKFADID